MPRPLHSLKAKALACIAQREHSRVELRRKLQAHAERLAQADGLAATDAAARTAEIETLLDWLEAKDLLSAERFVEMRVQVRSARFGNLRIRQELAQHGHALDPDATAALKASEQQRARAVWQRRFAEPAADAAGRAKQARFLAARGFSPEVIRRVVAGATDDD